MSEVIKIRGRLEGVRMGPSISRHVMPELASSMSAPLVPDEDLGDGAPVASGIGGNVVNLDERLEAEYQRGRAEGRREAEAEAQRKRDRAVAEADERMGKFLAVLETEWQALTARLEREAFRFALAAAGRIVKRDVVIDDEVVVRQIQEGLRRVVGMESVRLRVNPADEAMVRHQRELLLAGSESVRELIVDVDEKVERGGCILETASGTVDARLFAQLEQIEAALFGQMVS